MSVQGEIIRITEAKTDIASAINEQGYTLVDEDASISTYADAIRANTNTIWELVTINTGDISDIKKGYLPLTGGTVTGRVYISLSGPLSMFNVGNDDSMGVVTIHAGIPNEYVSLQCSQDNVLDVNGGISVFEDVTARSFVIDNGTNDYVLLAGGGTKPLSELGGITAEIDPIFQASPAHAVTTSHVETLNDLEAGYITTENEVFQIVDALDNIVTEVSGDGITTTKVQVGVSDNSPIITDTNITFNKTGLYDEVTTFINADKVITPSVETPFFSNIGGTSMFDSGEVEISSSNITIEGESYIDIYNSTPITFVNDKLLSFTDTSGKIITTIDGTGIATSTISADTIKISGGTDDFVLLAGGGYTPLNEITAGLATENYVINKIAEAELAGGDVDLSGLATKDDLKNYASISALAGYLPLTGGSLTGDLSITGTVSFLDPGTGGYIPLILLPALGNVIGFNGDDDYIELNHNGALSGVRIDGQVKFKQEAAFQNGFTVGSTSCLFGGTSSIGEYDYTHEDESTETLFEIYSDYPIMLRHCGSDETIFRLTGDGASINNPISVHHGNYGAIYGSSEMYFNNGGIDCTDETSVNFYGFESSLSFDEGGYSHWYSPTSTIHSDGLTIGGFGGDEAMVYLGHGLSNYIATTDQDSTLSIRSAEKISLSASGDSIYLIAPSISLDSYDISASGAIAASGFLVKNSSDDYVLLAGGGTKLLSDIKPDVSGYLPLTGGTLSGNFKVADIFSVSTNNTENNIDIIIGDYSSNKAVRIAYSASYTEDGELDIINNPHLIVGPTTSASLHINRCGMQAVSMNTTPALLYLNPQGGTTNFGGDVMASAFYETSDARKKDIKEDLSLDKCYDLIDKCQTVIYSLKDQTKEQVGMIAQEIEEFFPEVVATDEEGFKSLAYDRLVVICFKVLKDVIKRLEKLEQ